MTRRKSDRKLAFKKRDRKKKSSEIDYEDMSTSELRQLIGDTTDKKKKDELLKLILQRDKKVRKVCKQN